MYDSRWYKNILTFLKYFILLLLSIFVRLTLFEIFKQLFYWYSLIAAQRVCAKHLDIIFSFISEKVFFVYCLKLISKHVKIVQIKI